MNERRFKWQLEASKQPMGNRGNTRTLSTCLKPGNNYYALLTIYPKKFKLILSTIMIICEQRRDPVIQNAYMTGKEKDTKKEREKVREDA